MLRERDVEAYLVKRVEAMGGETRKVQWVGRDGAPDRLVMLPATVGGPLHPPGQYVTPARTVWVEVKAEGLGAKFPRNAHERTQHREHARMRALGQHVVVIDSLAGVEELLR